MRSIKGFSPWFAFDSITQEGDAPEREGAAYRLWSGAVPYLLTAMSVAVALYGSLALERLGVRNLEFALFLFAIAFTIWYPGVGPAILAVVLSCLAFNYYFVEPRHTLAVEPADAPYFIAFLLFAVLLTGFGVVRRRAEQELIRSRDQLRQEVAERQRGEEQIRERTRLAGEIHDTLAQGLAMTVMQLADAEVKLGPAWTLAEKPLGLVRELAVESLAYARRSVTMLQPSAPAAGLARAIRDVVDSGRRHFGGTLNFAVTGNAVLLPASVEAALAGIAREALTNATRHSGAPRVEVELAFQDGGAVRLAVADDGVGFDVQNVPTDAYGLTSMQDRAARAGVALTFVTEPGAGTEVVASWSP